MPPTTKPAATKSSKAPTPPPQADLPAPQYPAIEAFVERATAADVDDVFSQIQQQLKDLKGPRAQQARKVETAISRTRELLSYLVEVREKLEADKKGGGKGRR